MKAEILSKKPTSGSIDEIQFDAVGNCTWIQFEDSNYEDWCGVFGQGWGGSCSVCINNEGIAFIISNGQGYIIDVNKRTLMHKTECDYLIQCKEINGKDLFIASDFIKIFLYSYDKLEFVSERISIDGIEFLETNLEQVSGKVSDLENWYTFTFDLKNYRYNCQWKCPID